MKTILFLSLLSGAVVAGEPSTSFEGNVGIGFNYVKENALLVRSGSPTEDEYQISSTVQIQKFSHSGDNIYSNPKALRVINNVYDGVSAAEWGISGELNSYTSSRSAGNVATSGVARKFAHGQVFGGHFQAKDETGMASNDPTYGGSIVGVEINLNASGDDNYITPTGYPGVRIGLDMPAHTQEDGANRGKYAAGIRVHNSANGGVWKKGIHVYDKYGTDVGEEPMQTGVEVTTSGDNSVLINGQPITGLRINTNGAFGAVIEGPHAQAAIRIPANQFISLEDTNQIKFRYEVVGGVGRIQFYSGTRKIGYLSTSVLQNRQLN